MGQKALNLTASIWFPDCFDSGPSPGALSASGLGLAWLNAFRIEAGRRIVIETPQRETRIMRYELTD